MEQLAQLGLEVHTQEFAAVLPHLQHPVNGSNVYATLRAQRGSGMEALLIHVPMDNIYSVSFALAFANFCKGKGIWAKDLVFLFTSEDEWGPQAWVEAYFGIHNPKLLHEPLLSRSGSIQAAITLDLHTFNINHIDISTVSQNGLLPNQDIFNALVTVCKKSGMAVSFDGQPSGGEFYESSDYVGLVKTLMNMVALQASGHQSGLHGAFVRYHIDALTIRGGGPSGAHVSGLMKFGRCVEGLLRSMNNLLEKLHHSYYTFLTLSSSKYLSISVYLPPLVLVLVVPLLDCIELWMVGNEPKLLDNSTVDNTESNDSYPSFPVRHVCSVFLYGGVTGCVLYCIPSLLSWCGLLDAPTLTHTLLGTFALFSLLPILHRVEVTESQWRLLKFICNLLLVTTIFALAVLNFSLSFTISVFASMPMLLTRPSSGKESSLLSMLRSFLLLVASPALVPFLVMVVYRYVYVAGEEDPLPLLFSSWEMYVAGVMKTYSIYVVFHQWVYPVMCWGVVPIWMVLWCLSQQRTHTARKPHID